MPQCCVVPECSNRKSGHRFPKDTYLLKKWMVAIRRDTVLQGGKVREVSPSPHWRVCNDHFAPEDFVVPRDSVSKNQRPILKKDVVPSRFAWTKRASDSAIGKQEQNIQVQSHIVTARLIENSDLIEKKPVNNSVPPPLVYFSQPTEELEEIEHVNVNEIKGEPVEFLEGVEAEGAEFHVKAEYREGAEFHVEAAYHNKDECHQVVDCQRKDAEVQCSLCSCGCGPEKDCIITSSAFQISKACDHVSSYFRIEHLFNKNDELKFYTGFDNNDHLVSFFNLLGDQVENCLQSSSSNQTSTLANILSPVNQFFMTLIKLRRDMTYIELGFRFGVTSTLASIIVVAWINFLYNRLKELKICTKSEEMIKDFEMERETCSSMGIKTPTEASESQQQTYTIYKFCGAFEVIVGILPNGKVNFVSEAFGNSISNRELLDKCCLKNLLQEGDVILVNEGSNFKEVHSYFKDCVTQKIVTFKTPSLLKSKSHQYGRVNNLERTYAILQNRLPSDLDRLVSKIIYVCFMLANFLPNV